jgi:hypothetical protein
MERLIGLVALAGAIWVGYDYLIDRDEVRGKVTKAEVHHLIDKTYFEMESKGKTHYWGVPIEEYSIKVGDSVEVVKKSRLEEFFSFPTQVTSKDFRDKQPDGSLKIRREEYKIPASYKKL